MNGNGKPSLVHPSLWVERLRRRNYDRSGIPKFNIPASRILSVDGKIGQFVIWKRLFPQLSPVLCQILPH